MIGHYTSLAVTATSAGALVNSGVNSPDIKPNRIEAVQYNSKGSSRQCRRTSERCTAPPVVQLSKQ